jgi:hypothetical protein
LGAHDIESPVIMPFEEGSSPVINAGKSISNIMRVRQTFGQNSHIGALITDRHFEMGGSGSLFSLDGFFRLSKSISFKLQTIASHTDEPSDTMITSGYEKSEDTTYAEYYFDGKHTAAFDGEKFWGHAFIGLLDYNGRNAFVSLRVSEISPTYRADNGYEPRNNQRMISFISNYMFRYDGLVEWVQPHIFIAKLWNNDGKPKDRWINADLSTRLRKAQMYFSLSYMRSAENYAGIQFYNIWDISLNFNTTPSYLFAFGGRVNYGHRIARGDKVMGKERALFGWVDLRPIDRVYLETWINQIQSHNLDTDEELFKGYIVRSRLSLQLSRELSFRFVAQYNDFGKTWDFDPLITYQISPFSLFYIGTTYDYEKIYGLNKDHRMMAPEGEAGYNRTKLSSRQFFMKLQYMFQL